MQSTAPLSQRNGVDTVALGSTVIAIHSNPKLAQFRFRVRNRLVEGGLNRSEIGEFYGAETAHRNGLEPFVVHNDEPAVLLSGDEAPNPVEYLLQALLGCLTTTTAYKATANRIDITSISSEVEGDLDLRGMLGLDSNVRPGLQEVRATLRIKSPGRDHRLLTFYQNSPVYDTLSRGVPVKVEVLLED